MKRILLFLLLSQSLLAQKGISIRATVSEATTNFNFGKGFNYLYAGNASAVSPGVDVEIKLAPIRFKKMMKVIAVYNTSNKALLIGVNYVKSNFSETGLSYDKDPTLSRMETKYIHVPTLLKYNMQLFLLDENFHASFAIGAMHSFLLQSHLYEEATDNTYAVDANNVMRMVASELYVDEKDVTKYGVKYTASFCFDLSFSFKRLYIGERAFFGFKDQYMKGLENNWAVPRDQSIYLSAYEAGPKLTLGGGFFYIGWRLN